MRKPTLHKLFGGSNRVGLSNVLTSTADLNDAIVSHPSIENLSFLPSGIIPPRPAELLGSRTMSELIEELKERYDFLLFDSPPALLVTDPIVLSSEFDAVIGVIRAGKATRPVVLRLADLLRRRARNTVGLILNAVDTRSAEYYYTYGYYGGDGYYSSDSNGAGRTK
jgi:capsular exopolysaccharide synthesis family protein